MANESGKVTIADVIGYIKRRAASYHAIGVEDPDPLVRQGGRMIGRRLDQYVAAIEALEAKADSIPTPPQPAKGEEEKA